MVVPFAHNVVPAVITADFVDQLIIGGGFTDFLQKITNVAARKHLLMQMIAWVRQHVASTTTKEQLQQFIASYGVQSQTHLYLALVIERSLQLNLTNVIPMALSYSDSLLLIAMRLQESRARGDGKIDLSNTGLHAAMSPSLIEMLELFLGRAVIGLDLGWNDLTSIPIELGQLTELQVLDLKGNYQIAGSIPVSLRRSGLRIVR